MYYALEYLRRQDSAGDEFDCFSYDLIDEDLLDEPWYRGVVLQRAKVDPVEIRFDYDDPFAGYFSDYLVAPVPMVTGRVRRAIDDAGVSNIQWYPVVVSNIREAPASPQYYAMNVVGLVAAAGPSSSSTEVFGSMGANMFDRFVLNERAVRGLKIFRLAEQLATIMVCDQVKAAVESAGVNTLRFVPSNDWTS